MDGMSTIKFREIITTVDSRYLEIEGTLKNIRLVVLRKKQLEQPKFTNDYVI